MASLIDPEETERSYRKIQADIHRVVASIRQMDDRTLWRFVKTLAYRASQHHDFGKVPFDLATHFVIEHHDMPNAGSGPMRRECSHAGQPISQAMKTQNQQDGAALDPVGGSLDLDVMPDLPEIDLETDPNAAIVKYKCGYAEFNGARGKRERYAQMLLEMLHKEGKANRRE